MLVTVLIIAVTFGAESEFKFRIGNLSSSADGTFMFGYAARGGFSSNRIPEFTGTGGTLHSLTRGAEAPSSYDEEENNKVKKGRADCNPRKCVAGNKHI